jgi:NAD+ synthase
MSLILPQPEHTTQEILQFLRQTFQKAHKSRAVIAVSGGIDSAVALTLLTQALGPENVTAMLLPHHLQPMEDALKILRYVGIPTENTVEIDIKPMVDEIAEPLRLKEEDSVRYGNLKARTRMICVFDLAKKLDALVCGTENKSEHYLGYFTRFGDAASDIEPICQLYKTQVRQLAQFLQLPEIFLTKAPSAGLWIGQTDEEEMGFSYEQADQVLEQLIDAKMPAESIQLEGVSQEVIQKVAQQVQVMQFKREVPYTP